MICVVHDSLLHCWGGGCRKGTVLSNFPKNITSRCTAFNHKSATHRYKFRGDFPFVSATLRRMHSSRMRTDCRLTVAWHILGGGGGCGCLIRVGGCGYLVIGVGCGCLERGGGVNATHPFYATPSPSIPHPLVSVDRMTDVCKNITVTHTTYAVGKIFTCHHVFLSNRLQKYDNKLTTFIRTK